MHTKAEEQRGEDWPRAKRWLESLLVVECILIIASPFVGLTSAILYSMFLSERGVGLFGTPGWALYWEFHTGPVGGTLLAFELAPLLILIVALGVMQVWLSWGERSSHAEP